MERQLLVKYNPADITNGMILSGKPFSDPSQNVDSCFGDSGGPLLYDYNGTTYLVGLVSWGNGCALYGYPGVNTDITPTEKKNETKKSLFSVM